MKPLPVALLLACCSGLTAPLFAQAAPANVDNTPTLHARANLVVVDVIVTDAEHHPIKGLKREQFSVTESRAPQAIKGFEEHTAPSNAETAKLPAMPKMPPGIFTNYVPGPSGGSAVNVLLLDALNTPLSDQQYVRQQLLDYVKKEKPGTSVAIFGLSQQLVMLQGFTSDPNLLRDIVLRQSGKSSTLIGTGTGDQGAGQDAISDTVAASQPPTSAPGTSSGLNNSTVGAGDIVSNLKTFEDIQESFLLSLRIRYTLDALNDLARYLASIPGRKNLIWFSGSFPLNVLPPDDGSSNPFASMISMQDEYRDTVNLLSRAQVAVYPVDARGLQTIPMYNAQQRGGRYSSNPSNFNKDLSKFQQQNDSEHQTMNAMAEDTGGQAFYNTNALADAVTKAIDNGSNYYTIAYSPSDVKYNGAFRKIDVRLSVPGYQLSFRHGYYADDPDDPKKALSNRPAASTAAAPSPVDANSAETAVGKNMMQKAMQHGVPGSTQIIYTVRVLPATPPGVTEDALAEGNVANRPGFGPIKPPYRKYRVDFGTDPSNVVFTAGPDKVYHATVEFVSFVYDPDGHLLNSISNELSFSLTPARYVAMMKSGGLTLTQQISAPDKGDFFIRTGVHDLNSNHIGSTELPLVLIKNLPPLAAPPQSAPAK